MPRPDLFDFHRLALARAHGFEAVYAMCGVIFAAACLAMAWSLISLARARPDLQRGRVIYPIATFILACGTARLMSFSTPWLRVAGLDNAFEAAMTCMAVLTAFLVWRGVAAWVGWPSPVESARIIDEFTVTVADQMRTLAVLRESGDLARDVNIALETLIVERTAELKAVNERLLGIVNSAMDALITIDDQRRVVLFNPAAVRMFGLGAEDAIGKPIETLIPERFRPNPAGQARSFDATGIAGRGMDDLMVATGLRANGETFPLEASISQVDDGSAKMSTVIIRDVSERQAAEAARQLLAEEVDHRAKNALAIVQAVVSLTRAPTKEAFVEAVLGRISALARAHTILAENRWQGGDLFRIIADETAPYEKPGQIRMLGVSVVVNLSAVQPISLIVHELATNALKYGALSVDEGLIDIEVRILEGGDLRLSWTERDGPAVAPPTTTGFGATLITRIASRQLRGRIEADWLADGLRVVATLPPSTHDQAHVHSQLAAPG